ncbi:peptidylprolyl isomerase [Tetragenococcus koreensis]|uniref:Peptidyl-prolyl cis-trans isomerase n=1 Tax=Tetragenococcus koreensis TaxID=290335 RepID=A0AAN4RIK6_9ENTE|nr:peptidylprolyl isomerase [Tetragenococcus koreensis]AYW44964.1 peptidylprolyl isomerase [Tetragenococcus koreensis]MDN6665005.1 peptidylprolyl isomerase [Tetragenococcus koreensis]GEN91870.1 peptidyl-prolyl cis-trans isomerase [Tetragenococcus koreensis]GEQ48263.1 peptidyl-prolyl cis-trans isomerase [Tetragenococcus koreensis]GEQ50668.1 peptidyl-prolyl cis-trans isomerase [Tetragenococcus koreensis]
MKKTIFPLLGTAFVSLLLLSACTNDASQTTTSSQATTEPSVDLNALELPQLDQEPKDNEDVIEMETDAGKITVKLFPKIAPKAVENFMTHAKNGYYDETTFHRVVDEFMIQGGDPEGDGSGGESIWEKGFEIEPSNQLYHLRGALSMARGQETDSQGSQFFIVQNDEDVSDGLAIQFTPEKIIEAYKNGGAPQLDDDYTVFGQVIDGMDVVDEIAQADVKESDSGENSTPEDPVKIDKITIKQEAE